MSFYYIYLPTNIGFTHISYPECIKHKRVFKKLPTEKAVNLKFITTTFQTVPQ